MQPALQLRAQPTQALRDATLRRIPVNMRLSSVLVLSPAVVVVVERLPGQLSPTTARHHCRLQLAPEPLQPLHRLTRRQVRRRRLLRLWLRRRRHRRIAARLRRRCEQALQSCNGGSRILLLLLLTPRCRSRRRGSSSSSSLRSKAPPPPGHRRANVALPTARLLPAASVLLGVGAREACRKHAIHVRERAEDACDCRTTTLLLLLHHPRCVGRNSSGGGGWVWRRRRRWRRQQRWLWPQSSPGIFGCHVRQGVAGGGAVADITRRRQRLFFFGGGGNQHRLRWRLAGSRLVLSASSSGHGFSDGAHVCVCGHVSMKYRYCSF
eukprot:Rhum_TRINITY_DN8751_c0_g1::Rhum_TRINITY_DN8751_c0_g1_i1::g.29723::m.29723